VKHLIPHFDQLRQRYPAGFESSLVLPCLRRIQEDRGFVAEEDIVGLADYLGVQRIQIEEVLSHYTQFRRQPTGQWHLQVCHNLSCSMRGAQGLLAHCKSRLGLVPGQTTADGRFTLSTAECLGSCGTAPVLMVGDSYRENMSVEALDALIEELGK
jgi:NADH-quinone oxidoreductase subunit E